jgi:hypothetical protein
VQVLRSAVVQGLVDVGVAYWSCHTSTHTNLVQGLVDVGVAYWSCLSSTEHTDLIQGLVDVSVAVLVVRVEVLPQRGGEHGGPLRKREQPRTPQPQPRLLRRHAVHRDLARYLAEPAHIIIIIIISLLTLNHAKYYKFLLIL